MVENYFHRTIIIIFNRKFLKIIKKFSIQIFLSTGLKNKKVFFFVDNWDKIKLIFDMAVVHLNIKDLY